MRSTAFDAQEALYDRLDAATWPGRVTITLGTPLNLEADHVWVSGSVDDYPSDYRISGLGQRDERYTLRVHVWAKRLGQYRDARDRAAALAEVAEDVITGDHTLTGTVDLATLNRYTVEDAVDQDGRAHVVLITLAVDVQARVVDP